MTYWTGRIGTSGKPRYIEIAEAIAEAIRTGQLHDGDRLPPQRRLADQLGLDFTTVSRGYVEARSRGLVTSHVGRGTFVTAATMPPEPMMAPAEVEEDLSMNLPPEPQDAALAAQMQQGLSHLAANILPLMRYQASLGSGRSIMAASSWLSSRGLVPKMERIAITPGAHATIAAVMSIVAQPGDRILCEGITYPGVRSIAGRLGMTLVGLPMDGMGILPDALEAAILREAPRALYLNPTLQNPTTITMPLDRRLEVAAILQRHGIPLIEDDAYGFIPHRSPAPIALSAPELTWYIGSVSKCVGAGLRLAYTVAPSGKECHALGQAVRALSVMSSPLSIALMSAWIEDGTADKIRRAIRAEATLRQKIAADSLEGLTYRSDPEAFNIWLSLPPGISRADVVGRMAGRKIGLMPADAFTVAGPAENMLRVCLGGSIAQEALKQHLLFLANALTPHVYMG